MEIINIPSTNSTISNVVAGATPHTTPMLIDLFNILAIHIGSDNRSVVIVHNCENYANLITFTYNDLTVAKYAIEYIVSQIKEKLDIVNNSRSIVSLDDDDDVDLPINKPLL